MRLFPPAPRWQRTSGHAKSKVHARPLRIASPSCLILSGVRAILSGACADASAYFLDLRGFGVTSDGLTLRMVMEGAATASASFSPSSHR